MDKRDYYEVLGIRRDAPQEEIKQAYRRLARQYHPDVAQDKEHAEAHFKEINEAYAVLGDPEKREQYDRFGHAGVKVGAGVGDWGFGPFMDFGGISDLFESFFDFGERRGRESRTRRGADLRYDLEITLEDAFTGKETEISVTSLITCGRCKGSRTEPGTDLEICSICRGSGQVSQIQRTPFGQIMRSYICHKCNGEGRIIISFCTECNGTGAVQKKRKISVRIPPGVDSGSRIRIPGEGEPGVQGGPPGDLYVFINVKPHATFERHRDDLYCSIKLTFTQAALGGEIEIPALDEGRTLKIPSGTQNDTFFKIKGKGMPSLQGYGRGDLHVKVQIMVPTKLNERQKQLLREFAKAGSQEAETEKGIFDKIKDAILGE